MNRRFWSVLAIVVLTAPAALADDAADRFQESVELESASKAQEALDSLEKIRGNLRNSYMFHLRKGWLNYLLGQYESSIAAYGMAARLEPEAIEPLLAVMMPQMAARKWVDAERAGKAVIARDPENYLANSRLAYIHYSQARYGQSKTFYKKVLDGYPGDVDMRSGYGWSLLRLGDRSGACAQFRKILAIAPKHQYALDGLEQCE